jgi:hypothetical protein
MAFTYGTGTQADPYLLTNWGDVQLLFTSYLTSGKYFALVADLDCSATQISYLNTSTAIFHIDGRGYSLVVNIRNTAYSTSYIFYEWGAGTLKNIKLKFIHTGWYKNVGADAAFTISNVFLEFSSAEQYGPSQLVKGSNSIISGGNIGVLSGVNIYKNGSVIGNTINTSSFPDGNPYSKSNYALDEQYWIFDGVSLPKPRPQSTVDLTIRQCVKGKTSVGGAGKSRSVGIYTPSNGYRYKLLSSGSDGNYLAVLNDVIEPVIVMHFDDPGLLFAASKGYVLGDRIHPKIPNGYVYVCTTAGISSTSIPAVWPTSGTITSGGAIFTAIPIYAPASHMAVPQAVNIITGEAA